MKKKKGQQGFTFIEILTVVVILSILIGVGLPAYFWVREDTREQKRNQAIHKVEEAKIKFYNANKTAAATVTHPSPAQLAYYLVTPAGDDPGIFYSTNANTIFPNVFPSNQVWYLDPKARGQKPEFVRLDE